MCSFEDFNGSHCSTGGVIYTLGTSDLGVTPARESLMPLTPATGAEVLSPGNAL